MTARRKYRQILVRNIGVFWSRDGVFWGSPGKRGELLGVPEDGWSKEPTDFWYQMGVYALYGGYDLVYVGQTRNRGLGPRLNDHRWDHLAGRWNRFSWFGVRNVRETDGMLSDPPATRYLSLQTVLDHLEGVLIAVSEPPMNGQQGRFGERVVRFDQVPSEIPSEANLETLRRQLAELNNSLDGLARNRKS